MTVEKLTIDLDRMVRTGRNLLIAVNRMHDAGELGSAARIPDELARAIAVLDNCRNAAAYEAIGHTLTEVPA